MPVFMFTDVEGSTQSLEKYGHAFQEALTLHDSILKDLILQHGGRIISHTGDGIFSVFEDGKPIDPLTCVIEIQKTISNTNWGTIAEIRVRMALHAGPAEKRGEGNEENYYGPTVVRTARLLSTGWGGQILLTPSVAKACPLPSGATLQDLGVHVLKDLGEPQMIYGLIHPDLKLKEFPALRSISAHPHNLPIQSTPFVGRTEELKEISNLLLTSTCRLLTLLGPGGTGKTRLSLQAASEVIEHFSYGVYFVPLAPLNSAEFILSSIADAIKLPLRSNEDPQLQLLNYLKDKEMLLVMDNFEHLMAGADLLAVILEKASKVKLLVSSRERLSLAEELVFEVHGMEIPSGEKNDNVDKYGSVQLFIQNASRVAPHFHFSNEEKISVVKICQLVQGVPLAIELASVWVKTLSCKEIYEEILKNLNFLNSSLRNVPERHRNFRAVFEYSWRLLTNEEKDCFKKMSLFRGGFTKDAAQKITGVTLPVLLALVDKSLLNRRPNGRYEVHELLRQYAEEKLNEIPEEIKKNKDSLSAYFAQFLLDAEKDFNGNKMRELLDILKLDLENIRTAWDWSIEASQTNLTEKMVRSLQLYYGIQGPLQECEQIFEKAIQQLSPFENEKEKALLLAEILTVQGNTYFLLGKYEACIPLCVKGISLFKQFDAPAKLATLYQVKATVELSSGKYDDSRESHNEIIKICARLDLKTTMAWNLLELGVLDFIEGKYPQNLENIYKAKIIFDEVKNLTGSGLCLENIGKVWIATGDYEKAKNVLEESLSNSQKIGHKQDRILCLCIYAELIFLQKDYESAERLNQESLELAKNIGFNYAAAIALRLNGRIADVKKDHKKAAEKINEALSLLIEMGDKREIAISLAFLGAVSTSMGEKKEALEELKKALRIARDIQSPPVQLRAILEMAKLFILENKREEALPMLVLIQDHLAAEYDVKEETEKILFELKGTLPEKRDPNIFGKDASNILTSIIEKLI